MRHVRWWATLLAIALMSAPAVADKKPKLPSALQKKKKKKSVFGWTWPTKKRAYVGILATPITDELRAHFGAPKGIGMLVARVDAKSPAAKAGVQVGDVLVALNDQKVRSSWDVIDEIRDRKKGDRIKLRLVRARKPLTLNATLDVRQTPQVEVGSIMMRVPSFGSVQKAMEELQKQMPKRLQRFLAQEDELKRRLRQMERKLRRLERNLQASP